MLPPASKKFVNWRHCHHFQDRIKIVVVVVIIIIIIFNNFIIIHSCRKLYLYQITHKQICPYL